MKKEVGEVDDGDVPVRRERGEATTSCYPRLICQSRNHKGEVFFDLSTLKVAVFVDLSVIIVNIVNCFSSFIIKRGCFSDLGESVMCDRSGLLSL